MPDRGFPIGGWRLSGALRLRQGLFFAVLEEQWEHRDGSVKWKKACLEKMYLRPPFDFEYRNSDRPGGSPPIMKG